MLYVTGMRTADFVRRQFQTLLESDRIPHQSNNELSESRQIPYHVPVASTVTEYSNPSFSIYGPLSPISLIDPRLRFIEIRRWTSVPISNENAANIISLYLEKDHPLLGFFDPDLFLTNLCGGHETFCSSFLVSCLMYFSCVSITKVPLSTFTKAKKQNYKTFDRQSDYLRGLFLSEVKSRWLDVCREEDCALTVAACMILALGLVCDGEDRLGLMFKREGLALGIRLRLFGIRKSAREIAEDESAFANVYRGNAHIAWGVYCFIRLYGRDYEDLSLAIPPTYYVPR